jgi:hypothetical protein
VTRRRGLAAVAVAAATVVASLSAAVAVATAPGCARHAAPSAAPATPPLPPSRVPGESHAPFTPASIAVEASPNEVQRARVGDRVEIAAALPAGVDPAAAEVRLVLTDERGVDSITTGFVGGRRAVARRRLEQSGPRRWRLVLAGPGAERLLAEGRLLVAEAPLGATSGAIRVDARDPHRLVLPDGRPFWPRGENRFNVYDPRWSDGLSLEAYIARMHDRGENTLRVFVFNDCENEERADRLQLGCIEPRLGLFDDAQAHLFDRILDAGERHDVYIILTLFAVGFSEGEGEIWKSWADNPYSRARGGPAATARDFFTDATARAAAARRVRYAAARWGAYDHLLAIDLLNEPEWDGQIPEALWIPWVEEMSGVWRAADGGRHLVTAGPVGLHWNVALGAREATAGPTADAADAPDAVDERRLWGSGAVDVVEWHLYGKETYAVHALAHEMTRKVRETWRFDRPLLVGEFAYGGEPKPAYDHTHVGLFSAFFSGAGALAHSAPQFQIDSDEPMTDERARHMRALAAVTARIGDTPCSPNRPRVAAPTGISAWSLDGPRLHAIWLLAPESGYGEPVPAGARVTLAAEVAPGRWRLEWRDEDRPELPLLAPPVEIAADGGPLTLTAPSFVRHAVGFLVRH